MVTTATSVSYCRRGATAVGELLPSIYGIVSIFKKHFYQLSCTDCFIATVSISPKDKNERSPGLNKDFQYRL